MTNAQHTPGPWVYQSGFIVPEKRSEAFLENDKEPYICRFGPMAENANANARLIAAAPELLAFAIATAQTFGADTMIGSEARAVIAKAEGK